MSAISIPTKPLATTLLPQPRKQGFTMIEIVLVLVLLGILAAVAIPKYFDLQKSGRVKVCEHNRAVIVSTIEKQETLARYSKDVGIFDYKSQTGAAASAQHILNVMYPAGQKENRLPERRHRYHQNDSRRKRQGLLLHCRLLHSCAGLNDRHAHGRHGLRGLVQVCVP